MEIPSFEKLETDRLAHRKQSKDVKYVLRLLYQFLTTGTTNTNQCKSFAIGMHPNPRLYKYYWWIFWQGSACDGEEFLANQYRLSSKAAFDLMKNLDKADEDYWIYNQRIPRDDANTPLDKKSKRWSDITTWAPSYDDDADDMWNEFK